MINMLVVGDIMDDKIKHIVCYSGGHSSGICAIEVARRFGVENTILVNHDIHFTVESPDIKRFKTEVSNYLNIPITYANHPNSEMDQFDVCVAAGAFKVNDGHELCTSRLKTEPFRKYLKDFHSDKKCIIYYGFDANEQHRIQRRSGILGEQGYKTDYPLIWKKRTIFNTEEILIFRPNTYDVFKHGNCVGCLKAGWQHWYIVYCTRPDIWLKAKWAEDEIGYSIHHDKTGQVFLEDMEERFEKMKNAGVVGTEHMPHQTFWANAKKVIKIHEEIIMDKPCECSF